MRINEMVGMMLDDAIEHVPDNLLIHIGSGPAYFFIGYKDEYYDDFDSVKMRYLNYYVESVIRDFEEIRAIKTIHQRFEPYYKFQSPHDWIQRDIIWILEARIDTAKKLEQRLYRHAETLDEFDYHINKRPIVEAYWTDSYRHDYGISLIVAGDEIGECFTRKEYLRVKEKDEKKNAKRRSDSGPAKVGRRPRQKSQSVPEMAAE